MKTIISSLCVVVLALFCLHQIEAQTNLVAQACDATRYKDVCLKTLNADPSSKTADIHGLARIALNAAAKKSKSIQSKVAKLQAKNTDKAKAQAYKDCVETYESANESLADSLSAIDKKRYNDVNMWVSSAMTDASTCEEGFEPEASKITKDNETFQQLCSNLLAIGNKAAGK